MIKTGLVSVTFRKLKPEEIVRLAAKSGLCGIEWGGDIHVPHGDTKRALEVAKMTEDAGLEIASYGSYYRVGCEGADVPEFGYILDTAAALHAPTIRVWAGNRGSSDADEAWWGKVVEESRRIASMAASCGIMLAYEYHVHTLTDTNKSACRLLKDVGHENMRTYWQPPVELSMDECAQGLRQVLPYLVNLHVYAWRQRDRLPLVEGKDAWHKYLGLAAKAGGNRYALLEFVKDDSPEQFLEDAAVLKNLVACVAK